MLTPNVSSNSIFIGKHLALLLLALSVDNMVLFNCPLWYLGLLLKWLQMTDKLHVSKRNCFFPVFQSEFLKQTFVFCLALDACCSVQVSPIYEAEYLSADLKLYRLVIPPNGLKLWYSPGCYSLLMSWKILFINYLVPSVPLAKNWAKTWKENKINKLSKHLG